MDGGREVYVAYDARQVSPSSKGKSICQSDSFFEKRFALEMPTAIKDEEGVGRMNSRLLWQLLANI